MYIFIYIWAFLAHKILLQNQTMNLSITIWVSCLKASTVGTGSDETARHCCFV